MGVDWTNIGAGHARDTLNVYIYVGNCVDSKHYNTNIISMPDI